MIHESRRDYDDDQDIPRWLRWTFIAINRVGFPIVAFGLMWYMAEVSIIKVISTVEQNTTVLAEIRNSLDRINNR